MKPIKILPEIKAKAMADFEKFLDDAKSIEDKVSFSVELGKIMNVHTVPVIQITPEAWCKMSQLIHGTDKEVAWHSTVQRTAEDTYLITDLFVYPQVVSGASVNTDQHGYETWLQQQNDEIFNSLRMQGHSHVNMSVSPSTTDWNLYMDMLKNMTRIPFYIFLIINKRHEMYILLYDFEKNVCFETKDCIWETLLANGDSLVDWEKNAIKAVNTPAPAPLASATNLPASRFGTIYNNPNKEVEREDNRWGDRLAYGGRY